MAQKTVRVEIPDGSPDKLFKLVGDIIEKDGELGAASLIKDLETLAQAQMDLPVAEKAQEDGDKAAKEAQKQHNIAASMLGIAPGQTRQMKGTLLYFVTDARDALLRKCRGNEETLSEWGFNVVLGEAHSPTKAQTPPAK